MSGAYLGYGVASTPLVASQVKPVADQLYGRIDRSNLPLHPFNNVLINASFDHWQRGNGPFSLSGAGRLFGPDRVEIQNLGANGTVTATRTPMSFGDYGSRSRLSATFACSGHSAAGDGALISERIEGVDSFAGGRVMVAKGLRVASGAVGSKVFIELVRNYGTGGSAEEYIPVGPVTLTATLTRYGIAVDVPSMSGKVIGTANDYLAVNIWLSAGTNYQARVQNQIGLQAIGVQVTDREVKEIRSGFGDQAPGFERVPKEIDFLRACRFYQAGYWRLLGACGAAGGYIGILIACKAGNWRIGPTITVFTTGAVSGYNGASSIVGLAAGTIASNEIYVQGNFGSTNSWGDAQGAYAVTAEF